MGESSPQSLPPPPRVRPKDKSKVESLMKRRYSVRGIPPVASIPEPFPSDLGNIDRAIETTMIEKVLISLRI